MLTEGKTSKNSKEEQLEKQYSLNLQQDMAEKDEIISSKCKWKNCHSRTICQGKIKDGDDL